MSWDKTTGMGSTYQEDDPTITHHIIDRPLVGKQHFNRVYVQPQWIFDCINENVLLPVNDYLPGAVLPPHLSPFVEEKEGDYVPPEKQRLINMKLGIVDEEVEKKVEKAKKATEEALKAEKKEPAKKAKKDEKAQKNGQANTKAKAAKGGKENGNKKASSDHDDDDEEEEDDDLDGSDDEVINDMKVDIDTPDEDESDDEPEEPEEDSEDEKKKKENKPVRSRYLHQPSNETLRTLAKSSTCAFRNQQSWLSKVNPRLRTSTWLSRNKWTRRRSCRR